MLSVVTRAVERVLVVEDNRSLRRTLQGALAERFTDVRACSTVAEAGALIAEWLPDLIVLDFKLPDGDARQVLDLAELREPAPVVVAVSGEAGPVDTFELAQRGVRAFLVKPLTLDELAQAIDMALETAPALEPHLRQAVGHRGLAEVTEEVREVMIDEALARAAGSRRGAARILDTSRQLLQYLLRRR
jgi:DNA-binding NtrC family response regulator